ncbi:3-deoxy-D-manno-octulosonic acid transferase [Chryseobacterium indoltheticum]|uniref:3-deoxy-D-manno-octulosonic acid transferase n=1 Tax=Chryseobacterium indoltheticum TaxID=254 RepID=A0A381JTA5_9FLAO|nr:glycosyltransferase N-terminal domain-containing protein [Chryseobacterium indoltheticum]AZA75704.1 3-deoxy-D-manno-octulosonic acid transferase [Chryseobacterium indoltheticum]SIQ48228.1 3-deoxy-D-manno-octulosonic-acid transferase [Chryseobacterium indoltheticum]SUY53839.1 3-deoxy-D-manno-octulosonic-acid transferase [Chryseobacterium indoltheticum]
MAILYSIFVNLLIFGMKVLSLFNDKTKKGVEGRKQSLDIVKSLFSPSDKVLWMHAASLGEYEQGLPVLQKLTKNFPNHKILITFFSPSGYENVVKKKHLADAVCYLPFDKESTVKEFVSQFDCELFFTVKYDYWYNLLAELKRKNVKTFVISALFYERQSFFTTYGKWFVKQLKQNITWFFHQTQHSYVLAKNIGLLKSSVTGDTRFDRVKQLRLRDNHVDFVEEFISNKKTIVFGSSWQAEEKIAKMISEKNKDLKIIIAPHDLKRVENLKQIFPSAILYSELKSSPTLQSSDSQTLIIDSIGLLSKLYSYADVASVGGGFHEAGLHNILEAATFGVPVIFGNHYKKNPEADNLILAKGGKSFEDEKSAAYFVLDLFKNEKMLLEMSENAEQFVTKQPNSSELILQKILSF